MHWFRVVFRNEVSLPHGGNNGWMDGELTSLSPIKRFKFKALLLHFQIRRLYPTFIYTLLYSRNKLFLFTPHLKVCSCKEKV